MKKKKLNIKLSNMLHIQLNNILNIQLNIQLNNMLNVQLNNLLNIKLNIQLKNMLNFFFSSRRRHTRSTRDWSSDVCSSDLRRLAVGAAAFPAENGDAAA